MKIKVTMKVGLTSYTGILGCNNQIPCTREFDKVKSFTHERCGFLQIRGAKGIIFSAQDVDQVEVVK